MKRPRRSWSRGKTTTVTVLPVALLATSIGCSSSLEASDLDIEHNAAFAAVGSSSFAFTDQGSAIEVVRFERGAEARSAEITLGGKLAGAPRVTPSVAADDDYLIIAAPVCTDEVTHDEPAPACLENGDLLWPAPIEVFRLDATTMAVAEVSPPPDLMKESTFVHSAVASAGGMSFLVASNDVASTLDDGYFEGRIRIVDDRESLIEDPVEGTAEFQSCELESGSFARTDQRPEVGGPSKRSYWYLPADEREWEQVEISDPDSTGSPRSAPVCVGDHLYFGYSKRDWSNLQIVRPGEWQFQTVATFPSPSSPEPMSGSRHGQVLVRDEAGASTYLLSPGEDQPVELADVFGRGAAEDFVAINDDVTAGLVLDSPLKHPNLRVVEAESVGRAQPSDSDLGFEVAPAENLRLADPFVAVLRETETFSRGDVAISELVVEYNGPEDHSVTRHDIEGSSRWVDGESWVRSPGKYVSTKPDIFVTPPGGGPLEGPVDQVSEMDAPDGAFSRPHHLVFGDDWASLTDAELEEAGMTARPQSGSLLLRSLDHDIYLRDGLVIKTVERFDESIIVTTVQSITSR